MRKANFFSGVLFTLLSVGLYNGDSLAEVSAKLSRGTLTLTGDGMGDDVLVVGTGPNQLRISVNGATEVHYGEVQNLKIDMKKGMDFVDIRRLEISGNLDVNMGGDLGDELEIEQSGIGGNVSLKAFSDLGFFGNSVGKNLTGVAGLPFDSGDGFTITVGRSFVLGNANLKGSHQSVDAVGVAGTFFANDLIVNLGGGADLLEIENNFVGRNLNMDGGKESDIVTSVLNEVAGLIKLKNFEIVF